MLLSEQAVKLLIDELLADYFNSVSYKIMLCLACLEEETELVNDIIEILKNASNMLNDNNVMTLFFFSHIVQI